MARSLCLVCLLLLNAVNSVPLPTNQSASLKDDEDFSEEGDYFEGDIILQPEQEEYFKAKKEGLKTLIRDPTAIWPQKTVYYQFAPNEFSFEQRNAILQALDDLMSVSCVRFVQRTTEPAYIVLRNNARGCAAAVGFHNYGPLDLFLGGPSCQTRGTIQHEFLHTLGFWHEHTRQDRDQHVTIHWPNISPGKEFNFDKRDPSEITNLNMPYDYGSVMHYRSIAFSKDLLSTTISSKVPSASYRMGQRIRFSDVDLAKLNRLYECPSNYYRGNELVGRAATIGDIGIGPNYVSNTGIGPSFGLSSLFNAGFIEPGYQLIIAPFKSSNDKKTNTTGAENIKMNSSVKTDMTKENVSVNKNVTEESN